MSYYTDINNIVENWSVKILNKSLPSNFKIERNNLYSNDIDILVSNDKEQIFKVDAQYSFNFAKYGDVRIDLMSAGFKKSNWSNYTTSEINKHLANTSHPFFEMEKIFDIRKYGKYFEDNNMAGVLYFLYNGEKPRFLTAESYKKLKIDYILYLPKNIILEEIYNPSFKHAYKVNDKSKYSLKESHDSAFICLNLKEICKKHNIPILNSLQEVDKIRDTFLNYIELKTNQYNQVF